MASPECIVLPEVESSALTSDIQTHFWSLGLLWVTVAGIPSPHSLTVRQPCFYPVRPPLMLTASYLGGKSWDEVPGQTGSGKKFHRSVISGADFTADVRHVPRELEVMPREWESLNAKAELACMHRDGHCLEAVMWYVHHLLEWVKTLKLCESKADPRWKRATEGRRPKNRS